MVNRIIYRSGLHIGEPAAEDDEQYLYECFVDLPILDQLRDIGSSKCILLGRTGSGKTAVLKMIENQGEHVVRIDPQEISFSYLSNSDILRFLVEVGCDLNVLFQLLWRHVLFTKAVGVYFENQTYLESSLDRLLDRQNPARLYFERYKNSFWIDQDTVIKEITDGFESKIASELEAAIGVEALAKVRSGVSASEATTHSQRREVVNRTKKAVSELQIRELGRAIDSLNDMINNKQKNYYLIIDDLDVNWVDTTIRFKMIKSLIDSIKSFRKVRNIKVIAALRSDVYERALREADFDGSFQPEKYEGNIVHIRWRTDDLRDLINKRITLLFRRQYTRQGVSFPDIFPTDVRKTSTFEYISGRTQYRPRDILAFVNLILDRAAGETEIRPKTILDAESEYSKKRFQALCVEWASVHPKLDGYLNFLKGRSGRVEYSEIALRELIFDLCLVVSDGECGNDDLQRACALYAKRENTSRLKDVASALVSILYKVGAIEIKLAKGEPYLASYRDEAIILPQQVNSETSFKVSPMLWRMLGITPNIG